MDSSRISFACPNCKKKVVAPQSRAGTSAICPGCQSRISIPPAWTAEDAGTTTTPDATAAASEADPRRDSVKGVHDAQGQPPSTDRAPNPTLTVEGSADNLLGARIAFLILPIYMGSLLFLLPSLWNENAKVGSGKVIFYLAIPLLGVALKSLQCVYWLSTDPFRAVAIGRYLYGIYFLIASLQIIPANWPKAKVEGPLDGVMLQQIDFGYGYQQVYVITKPAEFTEFDPSLSDFLGFLFRLGEELAQMATIYVFLSTAYRLLRGDRPQYTWENFCYDVTFGKTGKAYWAFEIGTR